MSKNIEIRTVIFDKNLNRVIEHDPIFEALFENIYALTELNVFLAQNGMIDQKFIHKLNISGIEHHLCYHTIDKDETFEFHFFLLSDSWLIINPTGCSDITDRLTGLLNEQNIISLLKHEIKRTQRDKANTSVLIVDIDHLKNINEMFGFIAGDYVLQSVAKIFKDNTRGSDAVGRYKGDKFIVSLHNTDAHGTMQYIKKFEHALKNIEFCFNDFNFDVDVTFGVTLCKEKDTATTLIQRAMQASNKAKKSHSEHIEFIL